MVEARSSIDTSSVPRHESNCREQILSALLTQSRKYAEENTWHRETIRDDPEWYEPRVWAAESSSRRDVFGKVIALVQQEYSTGESVDVVGLLEELHRECRITNDVRHEVSGIVAERSAKGSHSAFAKCASIVREESGFGWPENDPFLDTIRD